MGNTGSLFLYYVLYVLLLYCVLIQIIQWPVSGADRGGVTVKTYISRCTRCSKGRKRELAAHHTSGGKEKPRQMMAAAARTTEMAAAVPTTPETVTPAIPLEAVQTVNKLDIAQRQICVGRCLHVLASVCSVTVLAP